MSNPGQITVKISAIADEFNKVMGGVSSKVTGLGKDFDVVSLRLQTLSSNLSAAGSKMSLMLTLPIIGLGAAAVKSAASFETLETSMKTILGSSEAARNAMAWIEDFSATTPYQMDEVADAFKKLSAYGFDATRVIGTLGDTAAAMGKSLDQAVEMFADATTGEFERLKEFGVKARTEGDKVTFSYTENGQSLTKTVNKTSSDIAAGLNSIFAKYKGGMEEQSKTLNGSLSNMIDSLSRLGRIIGDSLAPFVKSMADVIGGAAKSLSSMDEGTRAWVVGIGIALAAIGPFLLVIGKLVAGYRAFILIQAGVTAAMQGHAVATGAAAAGSAIYTIAMKAATVATRLFTAAWALTPLGVIVAGVVALGAALYAIGSAIKSHTDKTRGMSEKAAEAARRNNELADAIKGVGESSQEAKQSVSDYMESLAGMSVQEKINKTKDAIRELENITRGLSSDDENRVKNLDKIRELSREITSLEKEQLQTRRQTQSQASDQFLKDRAAAQKEYYETVESHGKTAEEMENVRMQRRNRELNSQLDRNLITQEQYNELVEINAEETETKITEIRKREAEKQKQIEQQQNQFRERSAFNLLNSIVSFTAAIAEVQKQQVEEKYSRLSQAELDYQAFQNEQEAESYKKMSAKEKKEYDLKKKADESRVALEKKKNKELAAIARRQAIIERVATLFQIIADTAKGIMEAIALFPLTVGQPWVSLIGVAAGLQTAAVLAAPLPEAAWGGIYSTAHIAGEAGPEAQIPLSGPQGRAALSSMFAGMWDAFEARLAAKAGLPASGSSATIERSQPPSTLTVILQDAGRALGEFVGEIVEDGTKSGSIIVHARAVV